MKFFRKDPKKALRVVCVLRAGREYRPEHVHRLRNGIAAHLPDAEFVCLSDVPVDCARIPLRTDWPGWWAKMEMFHPYMRGDFLYLDLDTVVRGDLSDIAAACDRLTVMRDVYKPHLLQSSMMFIPETARAEIWDAFTASPARHMRLCTTRERWGDQGFLQDFWGQQAAFWQDRVPGQIVSYKVHCKRGVPADARIVIFHGKPRPWDVPAMWRVAA